MLKRGRYNRAFLHFSMMSVLAVGVMITPVLADTYPIFAAKNSVQRVPSPSNSEHSIEVDENVFETEISKKTRDTIVTYTVENGDTLSSIAQKFSQPSINNYISTDTIKWENNLTSDGLTVGQELRILPMTGIYYKVQAGDTVYTIAKKLNTNPQKIVDFTWNNFANSETVSLVAGQMLYVPDGIKPSEQSTTPQQPSYIAQAPQHIAFTGEGFHWPLSGEVTQGFSWYHPGIDIAGPIGTPIYAAKAGVVVDASGGWSYGYGNHVLIDHGSGFSSMYAHMTYFIVTNGQPVTAGQLIGYRGNTGRSTGSHLHFEIRSPRGNVNPLAYLQ